MELVPQAPIGCLRVYDAARLWPYLRHVFASYSLVTTKIPTLILHEFFANRIAANVADQMISGIVSG
jgi:hypothetical protein